MPCCLIRRMDNIGRRRAGADVGIRATLLRVAAAGAPLPARERTTTIMSLALYIVLRSATDARLFASLIDAIRRFFAIIYLHLLLRPMPLSMHAARVMPPDDSFIDDKAFEANQFWPPPYFDNITLAFSFHFTFTPRHIPPLRFP